MAGNKITIQFNEDILDNGSLTLSGLISNVVSSQSFTYSWVWATIRDSAFKVTLGTPTAIPGERTAINFIQAFNLDVNGTNLYSVTRSGNTVIITGVSTISTTITFDNAYAFKTLSPPVVADINFTYENITTSNFKIESVEYITYELNKCKFVIVGVTANQIITEVTSPITSTPNNNIFYFQYSRGQSGIIKIKNGFGIEIQRSFKAPSVLSVENFNFVVNNSPFGATISINRKNTFASSFEVIYTLEYGIGNIGDEEPLDYQDSNVFTNIEAGSYRMFIRDEYGCVKYKDVTVSSIINNRVAEFYISKSMSIRFAYREVLDYLTVYRNDENTLSCESEVRLPYKEIQQFQTNDIITTQFKSNYELNQAFIVRDGLADVEIPVVQESSNIGVKDKRDAIKYNIGEGKTGLYFTTGNVYDYDTDVITDTYAFNGSLPLWASLGGYFAIDNAWYKIDEIMYDENVNADVIVFTGGYSGSSTSVITSSIFNIFNYEVFQFDIDFSLYNNQDLQVKILCTDDDFDDLTLISEKINIKERQSGTVTIDYSNPENTDVFYATGISNRIRLPISKIDGSTDQSSEILKGDTTVNLLDSVVYETNKFEFLPVSRGIMIKIVEALNHKTVFINGVGYVLNGNVEVDERLGVTNLYVVRATMIKTGSIYNSKYSGDELFNPSYGNIPALIQLGDGNFIEYKS